MRRLVLPFCLLFALPGCRGDDTAAAGPLLDAMTPDDGATMAACDDYFAEVFAQACGAPALPATELTRIRPRFEAQCASILALPGVGVTAGSLESCAQAVKASGCAVSQEGPCASLSGRLLPAIPANNYPLASGSLLPGLAGSLSQGAPCVDDLQCTSGSCDAYPVTGNAEGELFCGVCTGPPPNGSPCGCMGYTNDVCSGYVGCGAGQACDQDECLPITYGAAGAACDGLATQCSAGLYCDPSAHACAAPAHVGQGVACDGVATLCDPGLACVDLTCVAYDGGVGAPCNASGGEPSCAWPLVCIEQPNGQGTCASPGQSGTTCRRDDECAAGLGCDLQTIQCGSVTWSGAGAPCGGNVRCLVGTCATTTDDEGAGTCPTVIADGDPCAIGIDYVSSADTETCDTFAQCSQGVCVLGAPATCPPVTQLVPGEIE